MPPRQIPEDEWNLFLQLKKQIFDTQKELKEIWDELCKVQDSSAAVLPIPMPKPPSFIGENEEEEFEGAEPKVKVKTLNPEEGFQKILDLHHPKNWMSNLSAFFDRVRFDPFDGSMTEEQVKGCERILAYGDYYILKSNEAVSAVAMKNEISAKYVAYILATCFHETARRMHPIREYGGEKYFHRMYDIRGNRPHIAKILGNIYPGDGAKFPGMGEVQVTGRGNYLKLQTLMGIPLLENPKLMLQPWISTPAMYMGMFGGIYTGKKLPDQTNESGRFDAYEARTVVNGHDRARVIEGYYEDFLEAVHEGL